MEALRKWTGATMQPQRVFYRAGLWDVQGRGRHTSVDPAGYPLGGERDRSAMALGGSKCRSARGTYISMVGVVTDVAVTVGKIGTDRAVAGAVETFGGAGR